MKKILGILGITLIMAVSFFNMSSVIEVNQNVNLASVLQNANAQYEGSNDYEIDVTITKTVVKSIKIGKQDCTESTTTVTTDCYGSGDVFCVPFSITFDPEYEC